MQSRNTLVIYKIITLCNLQSRICCSVDESRHCKGCTQQDAGDIIISAQLYNNVQFNDHL